MWERTGIEEVGSRLERDSVQEEMVKCVRTGPGLVSGGLRT